MKNVDTAIKILFVTLAIGVPRAIIDASAMVALIPQCLGPGFTVLATGAMLGLMILLEDPFIAHLGLVFPVLVTAVTLGFLILVVVMIGRGKNWARILFLAMFLLGLLPALMGLIQSFSISPIGGLLGVCQTILQALALVFLFQRDASDWFRGRPVPRL